MDAFNILVHGSDKEFSDLLIKMKENEEKSKEKS
jgi:hypothetical protein